MATFGDVEVMMAAYKRMERIDVSKLTAQQQLDHASALGGLSAAIVRGTQANLKVLSAQGVKAKADLEKATKKLGNELDSLKKAVAVIARVNLFLQSVASVLKLLK